MPERCRHFDAGTYMRDGADHVGLDLYVKCRSCGFRGPHVECTEPTPELRKLVWRAWEQEIAQ